MLDLTNTTRGWILSLASGLACVLGALLINLDTLLHILPRFRHFSIQKSTTFLAASLSLSFGVMFFSALSSLLPSSQKYFGEAGYSAGRAQAVSMLWFLGGVAGLQVVSEGLHRCLPSSIVRCEEHKGAGEVKEVDVDVEAGELHNHEDHDHSHPRRPPLTSSHRAVQSERTPLLESSAPLQTPQPRPHQLRHTLTDTILHPTRRRDCSPTAGKCYGYGDHACQQRCGGMICIGMCKDQTPLALELADDDDLFPPSVATPISTPALTPKHTHSHDHDHSIPTPHVHPGDPGHHHVPQNRFLSIGLQTGIAIALHKFPEGFITYATNAANPDLGFSVFLALFIHNIAEGFAMVLPLYLAFGSKVKAVLWASLLGGCAQPVGAGIAAVMLRGKQRGGEGQGDGGMGKGVEAVLFAVTAGIMCSVGLQLFWQAVQIQHGSRLAFVCAFVGMGVLGLSNAITAE